MSQDYDNKFNPENNNNKPLGDKIMANMPAIVVGVVVLCAVVAGMGSRIAKKQKIVARLEQSHDQVTGYFREAIHKVDSLEKANAKLTAENEHLRTDVIPTDSVEKLVARVDSLVVPADSTAAKSKWLRENYTALLNAIEKADSTSAVLNRVDSIALENEKLVAANDSLMAVTKKRCPGTVNRPAAKKSGGKVVKAQQNTPAMSGKPKTQPVAQAKTQPSTPVELPVARVEAANGTIIVNPAKTADATAGQQIAVAVQPTPASAAQPASASVQQAQGNGVNITINNYVGTPSVDTIRNAQQELGAAAAVIRRVKYTREVYKSR